MNSNSNPISNRKQDHIDICLNKDVEGKQITNGFERYRLIHEALPEMDFDSIQTNATFLNKPLKVPFIVSSMTGGTSEATSINRKLAQAAEKKGWAFGIGSIRAALEQQELLASFQIRDVAPTVPVFTNLGAVQLNYGYGLEECKKAVEWIEADGIVLHLNSMQEVFQPEGERNFSQLLGKIEQLCKQLPVPLGVKEVGFGIHGALARSLFDAGVAFVDVAGAGGTSWIQVEKYRTNHPVLSMAAETFSEWGIPTADCVRDVRACCPRETLIASGGMKHGLEAAKAIALGADLVAFGKSLLASAVQSDEQQIELQMERLEFELKTAMFGTGVANLQQLRQQNRCILIS